MVSPSAIGISGPRRSDATIREVARFHLEMISDKARCEAYAAAIAAQVRPGDIVMDLGTGSGILSYFACLAGASRVYAVEHDPLTVRLAESFCSKIGFKEKVFFIQGDSHSVSLAERVDVIVTETMGSFGFDEGILANLADARDRFLKPGGRVIPGSLQIFVAPAEAGDIHRESEGEKILYRRLQPGNLLGLGTGLPEISFLDQRKPMSYSGRVRTKVLREGRLDGIACWFSAALSPNIVFANSLESPALWAQGFFPVRNPLKVDPGDSVEITLAVNSKGKFWKWDVRVEEKNYLHEGTNAIGMIAQDVPMPASPAGACEAKKNT